MSAEQNGRVGIVLTNLGGPGTLDEVEPFLTNLFSDRDIIPLPLGAKVQPVFARFLAKTRGPIVRRRYAGIGGGSPQLSLTTAQAAALEARLNNGNGGRYRGYVAMRYWHPFAEETLARLSADGISRFVVLTLYPQYSTATTGSMERELMRLLARPEWKDRFVASSIRSYARDSGYLEALAGTVRDSLNGFPQDRRDKVVLLFTAHALPSRIVEQGDPYVREIEATREGLLARLNVPNRHVLGYQSRSGPVRWIGPGTPEVLEELGREGVNDVLAIPVSFVSDHIETLYEVDQLFADKARRAGIRDFRRPAALNTHPAFIDALAGLVERHLNGSS